MSESDEIKITEDGQYLNYTLAEEWERYNEAKEELEIIYKELVVRSLRAKNKGQKIPGYIVNQGSMRRDNQAIKKIFEEKGWDFPTKENTDYKKMEKILKEKEIEVPEKMSNPYVYKKKKK